VIEKPDPIGKEAAETACQRGRDKEIADAESDFALGVEEGKVDGEAREETAFHSAEEKAACNEGAVAVTETGEGSNGAPSGGDERDPAGGAELFDDEVGGESSRDGIVRIGCDLACRGVRRAADVHARGNWIGR
jgi:hypothetical protein